MRKAKPYALNSEFCTELASEMVRSFCMCSSALYIHLISFVICPELLHVFLYSIYM